MWCNIGVFVVNFFLIFELLLLAMKLTPVQTYLEGEWIGLVVADLDL